MASAVVPANPLNVALKDLVKRPEFTPGALVPP